MDFRTALTHAEEEGVAIRGIDHEHGVTVIVSASRNMFCETIYHVERFDPHGKQNGHFDVPRSYGMLVMKLRQYAYLRSSQADWTIVEEESQ